jgi:hypothetical protein
MFTVTESVAVFVPFEQVSTYVRDAASLPVVCDPEIPVKPSGLTLQVFAPLDVHEIVAAVLCGMVIAMSEPFALMSAVICAFCTFTVTVSVAVPPGPVHESVYVRLAAKLPVLCEPVVPVKPSGETVHVVAFWEFQVRKAVVFCGMDTGPSEPFALMSAVTAGALFTFTITKSVAVPPGPVHESV